VALTPLNVAPAVKAAVEARYQAETGYRATVYTCQASEGAGEIT
jgi:galactokinase